MGNKIKNWFKLWIETFKFEKSIGVNLNLRYIYFIFELAVFITLVPLFFNVDTFIALIVLQLIAVLVKGFPQYKIILKWDKVTKLYLQKQYYNCRVALKDLQSEKESKPYIYISNDLKKYGK